MHWALWLLLANGAVAVTEHTYRAAHFASFWQALPWLALPIVCAQWSLFEGFRAAPNLIYAGILFSVINAVFRIVNSTILGEGVSVWQAAAVALVILSSFLGKIK